MQSFIAHTCDELLDRVKKAQSIVPPRPSSGGKGIITASGGRRLLSQTFVSISILRQHGCTLPIEIFHADEQELDDSSRNLIGTLGDVFFVNIQDEPLFTNYNARNFSIKALAVYLSRFSEILWMDADIIPFTNFDPLFSNQHYLTYHHYFHNDLFTYGKYQNDFSQKTRAFFESFGVPIFDGEPETDTGMFMLNKGKLDHRIFSINLLLNLNHHLTYQHNYGDKELFKLSFRLTNTPYTTIDKYPHIIGTYFPQEGILCGNAMLLPSTHSDNNFIAVHMTLHSIDHIDSYNDIWKSSLWTHYVTKPIDVNLLIVHPLNQEIVPRYKYDYKFMSTLTDSMKTIHDSMYTYYHYWKTRVS